LQAAATLVVTVETDEQFRGAVEDSIEALERGEPVDSTPTLSFASYDDLMGTFTPRVLELIEAIRREEPTSINEAACVVDRDVKNVHTELAELAQLGVIYFEAEGNAKRPVVWFDELVIRVPVAHDDASDATPATS
jgi:predicted transcriptional regulator